MFGAYIFGGRGEGIGYSEASSLGREQKTEDLDIVKVTKADA